MKPAGLVILISAAVAGAVAIVLLMNGSIWTSRTDRERPGDQEVPAGAVLDATPETSEPGMDAEAQVSIAETGSGPTLEIIAGQWGSPGGECHSGESFTLDASGEYSDEGSVGNWKLSRNTLTITTVDIEHAGLGPSETGTSPRTTVLSVMDVTPDSLTWTDDEGRKSKFSRCP